MLYNKRIRSYEWLWSVPCVRVYILQYICPPFIRLRILLEENEQEVFRRCGSFFKNYSMGWATSCSFATRTSTNATWLFTRLKNNGLVFSFFSHLVFIIDLSSSNSYKDTTDILCRKKEELKKKKLLEPGWSLHHTPRTHSFHLCVSFSFLVIFRAAPTAPYTTRCSHSRRPASQ